MSEIARFRERELLLANLHVHEPIQWRTAYRLEKFRVGERNPYEVIGGRGNLLVTAGATAMLNLLIGAGGTAFNNANAFLGVGDSTTAEAVGQTDLQAATNKLRVAMDATYPSVSGAVATWRATFTTGNGNFAWNEWALFNASVGGTMLNRKVRALGTKASGTEWVFQVTTTIS